MSKGIVVLAQNGETDYVMQACLLAMSLQTHNKETKISVITDDDVPLNYQKFFDNIIPIPFGDAAEESEWKVENRWKIYHASPYDETIVMDTDMLVLQNIDRWWDFLSNYELFFTNKVLDYRGNTANTSYYRKTFIDNNLPNLFAGFHYFKKSDFAQEFYTWLELVIQNWEAFYEKNLTPETRPKHVSIDVCAAIVTKILDCETEITNSKTSFPTFVHMKPYCQGWEQVKSSWQDKIPVYTTENCELQIGNYIQSGIFHYTENSFIEKTPVLKSYRSYNGV